MPAFVVPEINLSRKIRDNIGQEYALLVSEARDDRNRRMQDIWALALKNYEGKAEEVDFPWPGASNAVVSLTPSHTDAWAARLRNAGTAQDPVYLTSAWGAGEIVSGVTASEYAEIFQQYSKWLEKEEVSNDDFMEKVTTIAPKYGNAIVYINWEHEEIADIDYAEDGTIVKDADGNIPTIDLLNKPVIHVIHPKNFYMPSEEEDLQLSPWCGFDEYFTPDAIRANIKNDEWDKKATEEVLKFESEKTAKEKKAAGGAKNPAYFRRTEDGRHLNQNEWDREQKRTLSLPQRSTWGVIEFTHIFALIDTDEDGVMEQVEVILHVPSKKAVSIRHSRYQHKKRPLVMFSFYWREGTWMDMGVCEMLFNSQRIMDEIMRDMLDNNKIRNTKMFLAKAGAVIDADEPMFPGRIIQMENVQTDFAAIDMGSNSPATSLNDLSIVQAWAERRDGMTDFNLGRERSSRTPATTMLALLEEGSERVTAIIRRQRNAQTEVWTQVHQLYAQAGEAEGLDQVLGLEQAEKIRSVWRAMNVQDIRKKLVMNAQVSTQNLNRAIKRQESAALMGQLDAHHQRLIQLANILTQTQDPVLRALVISMAKSGEFLMRRILNTHDIKEHEDMNPDIVGAMGQLKPDLGPIPGAPGEAPRGAADQVTQAATQPSTQPTNAPGRPEAGIPRNDGGGGDSGIGQ